ncbi:phage tail assembly protein [Burkholderia gladioli]|uniref:phage tail assembly protein n=1 Tax=Burkholderia gladioli TaxID=28095 RepID=UPI003AFA0DFB
MENNEKKVRKIQPPTITIPLSENIVIKGTSGDDVKTDLELREPDFGQIQRFVKTVNSKGALAALRDLISEQAEIPTVALDKIKARDFYKAQEYLTFFLTPPDEDDPEGNGEGSQ